MAMGERKGTISNDVKEYIESHLEIKWGSSDSKKKLYKKFPLQNKKLLSKYIHNYLRDYRRDNVIKKFSYEEILEVRKMMKWWQEYALDPLKDLKPQKDEMVNRSYNLSLPIARKIKEIAKEEGLTATFIFNHQLKRFVMEYEANKQRQMNKKKKK